MLKFKQPVIPALNFSNYDKREKRVLNKLRSQKTMKKGSRTSNHSVTSDSPTKK